MLVPLFEFLHCFNFFPFTPKENSSKSLDSWQIVQTCVVFFMVISLACQFVIRVIRSNFNKKTSEENMKHEVINYKTPEEWHSLRSKVLTSTNISALFGVSPYLTEFELWHEKKNQSIITIQDNERMFWGRELEDTIAKAALKKLEKEGQPFKAFHQIQELRIGSSFDWLTNDNEILEVKNVDGLVYYKNWGKDTDDNEVAPLNLELQVQFQLLVSGLKKAYLVALVGGNTLKILPRERNEKVIEKIIEKTKAFWQSIDSNQEPEPNFEKDYEFLFKLFSYAEPEKVLELDGQGEIWKLATRFNEASKDEKNAKSQKNALKAEIFTKIGTHGKVKHSDFSMSATTNKKNVRAFRLTWRAE
ncbi:MAG: hypothetical protein DRI84_06370 [Bacteroidetes bacterium]|nr:MAG: hypothetical protein DRI84_06370 [Bacteroidota bacterium]